MSALTSCLCGYPVAPCEGLDKSYCWRTEQKFAASENRRDPAAICGMCETPVDCASQARCKIPRLKETPPSGDTPRTDRETYTIKPADVGFTAISPSLGKILERELSDSVPHHHWLAEQQRAERAEAELSALRFDIARQVEIANEYMRDALRYRWLRIGHNAMALINSYRWTTPEQMDAAIDRATGKGGEHG